MFLRDSVYGSHLAISGAASGRSDTIVMLCLGDEKWRRRWRRRQRKSWLATAVLAVLLEASGANGIAAAVGEDGVKDSGLRISIVM